MVVDWMRIDRRPLLVGSFTQGHLTLSSRIASADCGCQPLQHHHKRLKCSVNRKYYHLLLNYTSIGLTLYGHDYCKFGSIFWIYWRHRPRSSMPLPFQTFKPD